MNDERNPPEKFDAKDEGRFAQERDRVRKTCARIEGAWWEWIPGDGLGFVLIQMDELHNSVQLVRGRFHNETGDEIARWDSVAARVTEGGGKVSIVYLRQCRVPTREPQAWFHGYGDMYFEGSARTLDNGYGIFFDVNRDDPRKTLGKSVQLLRVQDQDEIVTMENGTAADRAALIKKVIGRLIRPASPRDQNFDVFLCHNSEDKPSVRRINKTLKRSGIRTWLDEGQLPLGLPWQDELKKRIGDSCVAAVFVGDSGFGPWQDKEVKAFLREFKRRRVPVIPVILPGATRVPELPPFLQRMQWLDLRRDTDQKLSRLIQTIRTRRDDEVA